MKLKTILMLALIIGVLAVSGCVSRGQYYVTAGIVEHNNSLEEAFEKCVESCEQLMYDYCVDLYGEGNEDVEACFERKRDDPTPRLSECSEKECQCEC